MAGTRADWWVPRLPPAQVEALVAALSDEDAARLYLAELHSDAWLRADQRPPAGPWRAWLVVGGRGSGKTYTGARWVIRKALENPGCRIALVARSAADVRDTVVRGESGILAQCPPWFRAVYRPTLRRVDFPNGAFATTYAAAEPDQLRGPQHAFALADEIGFWKKGEAWANLELGLRLGAHPQVLASTTPSATELYLDLVRGPKDKTTGKRTPRPDVIVTRAPMFKNRANLAPDFIRAMEAIANTARGKAEVYGEDVDLAEDALWDLELLAACRSSDGFVMAPERVVVGFDPSHSPDGSGDEAGIVAAARKSDGVVVVVGDYSMRGTPVDGWIAAFEAAEDVGADEIVYEDNPSPTVTPSFVSDTLRLARAQRPAPKGVKLVAQRSSTSKYQRAEPIATAYRVGRVQHHTASDLETLEAEMVSWSPSKAASPNRIDALVVAAARLILGDPRKPLAIV